jgi:CubicO group peptidase (beta-lactamase class C family)
MTARPTRSARLRIASACSLVSVLAIAGGTVEPGGAWASRKPADVGLDASALEDFGRAVGGRGCVVRHGYLAYAWGDPARRADVASAAKPVYAHFLFKAVADGRIGSLEEKVIRWEPRLGDLNAKLGHKDREIAWRHLATQTSCYGLAEKPGTAFCYNDWQMALFWDTLFLKVYGATFENVDENVLRPMLAGRLGCQDRPTFMAFGTGDRPGRLGISARDFARFGLLYLRKGAWRGARLLPPSLAVAAVTSPLPNDIPRAGRTAAEMLPGQRSIGSRSIPDNQTDHMGSYSWLWWTNGVDREGRRHWPDVPEDAFGAFGHGGPRAMVVLPGLDLIVSWNDANVRDRDAENGALSRLVKSVSRRGEGGGR